MKGGESLSDGEIESGTQEGVSAECAGTAHCGGDARHTSEDTCRHECIGTVGEFGN